MPAKLLSVLKEKFGLSAFRPVQSDVISNLLEGRSGLLIMPTGGGKSLCYQLPSQVLPGTVLVVSPLIALMKDQVDKLRAIGIKATFINSSINKEEREKRQKQLAAGELQILYVTPERFRKPEFVEAVKSVKISLFAIDEAHCIAQWGHDFRPEYARVGEIRKLLNNPLTLALTATATVEVQNEIIEKLGLNVPLDDELFAIPNKIEPGHDFLIKTSLERPGLAVNVLEVSGLDEKVRDTIGLLHANGKPAIVYFSLISSLYEFAKNLAKLNVRFEVYHGQLSDRDRKGAQDRFLKGESDLILATPAFGLGVDKSDVRQVIHGEVPSSMEAYFQEIGRSGRDGAGSTCTLFFDEDDVSIQMDFLKWANPDANFIRRVYRLVETNQLRVKSEGENFLRAEMNFFNSRDFRVETALGLLRSWDVLERDGWKILAPLDEDLLAEGLRDIRLKRQQQKLLTLIQWIDTEECRMQSIYKYFGEARSACGICDNCQINKMLDENESKLAKKKR